MNKPGQAYQEKFYANVSSLRDIALYLDGIKAGKGNLLPLGTIVLDDLWGVIKALNFDGRVESRPKENKPTPLNDDKVGEDNWVSLAAKVDRYTDEFIKSQMHKKYTQQQLEQAEKDAFNNARVLNEPDYHHTPYEFKTFQDYKNFVKDKDWILDYAKEAYRKSKEEDKCAFDEKRLNEQLENLRLNFHWTDELVREFIMGENCGYSIELLEKQISGFKQSKQSLSSNAQGKDWEIVSVKHLSTGAVINREEDIPFVNEKYYSIHSVKRLSDNEVFTIGDSVYYKLWGVNTGQWVINNFFIRDDGKMLARSKDNIHCEFVNNDLIKVKK